MNAHEIDNAQMTAEFEAMQTDIDSPEYAMLRSCRTRAQKLIAEHENANGEIKGALGLQDQIAEELQIIALLATKTAWRPIESAPKDGSHVVLRNGLNVVSAWWYAGAHHWWVDEVDGVHDGYHIDPTGPTHWMPLLRDAR